MKNPVKNGKENEQQPWLDPERYLESEWKQPDFKDIECDRLAQSYDIKSMVKEQEREWIVEAHGQVAGIRRNIVCFLFFLSLSLFAYSSFEFCVAVLSMLLG